MMALVSVIPTVFKQTIGTKLKKIRQTLETDECEKALQ